MIIILILAALVYGVVQWRANSREATAEANHPPAGQLIEVNGMTVHAWVKGSGPDLVLIHGANGNLRDFTFDLTARLTDKYRVIALDRPGLGWTDRLPGKSGAWNTQAETPLEQAALLQKAADRLGVKNPIVLGHSYGGAVAIAWGLSRPEQTAAMVLVAAVSEPWPGSLGWLYDLTSSAVGGALVIPPVTAFLPKSVVQSSIDVIFAPQHAPAGYGDHLGTGLTLRRETTRANAQQVNGLLPYVIDMQSQYDMLTMPIELVHGDTDTIVPAEVHANIFVQDVPTANLTMLEGLGHMPHHENPQAVVDAIDRAATRADLR